MHIYVIGIESADGLFSVRYDLGANKQLKPYSLQSSTFGSKSVEKSRTYCVKEKTETEKKPANMSEM